MVFGGVRVKGYTAARSLKNTNQIGRSPLMFHQTSFVKITTRKYLKWRKKTSRFLWIWILSLSEIAKIIDLYFIWMMISLHRKSNDTRFGNVRLQKVLFCTMSKWVLHISYYHTQNIWMFPKCIKISKTSWLPVNKVPINKYINFNFSGSTFSTLQTPGELILRISLFFKFLPGNPGLHSPLHWLQRRKIYTL